MDHYEACNRDGIAREDFRKLVERLQIRTIVETGTYHGVTTAYLATFGLPVHTIETSSELLKTARETLGPYPNVTIHHGHSSIVLGKLLKSLERPVFFFLDAHWYDDCPLRGELAAIADGCPDQAAIAIHDFKVPGKDFGYDTYKGKDFDLHHIEDLLPDVFPAGYKLWYNEEAEGARRGIIYLVAAQLDRPTEVTGAG